MFERQQQFESSIRRRQRRNVIEHSFKEENNYCLITTSLKFVYMHRFSIPKIQMDKHVFFFEL